MALDFSGFRFSILFTKSVVSFMNDLDLVVMEMIYKGRYFFCCTTITQHYRAPWLGALWFVYWFTLNMPATLLVISFLATISSKKNEKSTHLENIYE